MRLLRLSPLRLAAALVIGSLACGSVAYAASLGVGSGKLHAWSQTLTKASCNQTSTTEDDTYVREGSPTSTSGRSATTLTIGGSSSSKDYAFIRFDLTNCSLPTTGGADSATLTVYVTSSSSNTISLYPVYTSWSSSTLNWNGVSNLTVDSTATTSFTGSSGSHALTVTADVDAAIKAGALYGWELRYATSNSTTTAIASAQNSTSSHRPSLTLSDEK